MVKRSLILVFLPLFFLLSCASGGSGLYETFYIGNNMSQYFIKPMEMSNEEDDKFSIDFTLRQETTKEMKITANFSIMTEDPISSIDSLSFNKDHMINEVERLFVETRGDEFLVRSTSQLTSEELKYFFEKDAVEIVLYSDDRTFSFMTNSNVDDKREEIRNGLLKIVEFPDKKQ